MSSVQGKIPGINILLESRYRLTPQRKSILLALSSTKPGEHLTAEKIYSIVKKRSPQIGLATVYRTLDVFLKLSIIQCLVLENGSTCYELKGTVPHHHLICLSCGKVFEIETENIAVPSLKKTDFKVISSAAHYFGYCGKCQGTKKNFKERRK